MSIMFGGVCMIYIILSVMIFQMIEAGDKKGGDLFIIGGKSGCGPALLYKSNGKKGGKKGGGEMIIINNCEGHSEPSYSYVPYPMYHGGGGGGGYSHGGGGGYYRRRRSIQK